jgi:hypothetical protein
LVDKDFTGKAKPHRTVLRHSRSTVQALAVRFAFLVG